MKKISMFFALYFMLINIAGCYSIKTDEEIPNENLNRWLGEYTYYEFCPPDINILYTCEIYRDGSQYFANIYIDGFQKKDYAKAEVVGNENKIEMVFIEYLPDNIWGNYVEGNILLRFYYEDDLLYTNWGEIQPDLHDTEGRWEIAFEKEKQSTITVDDNTALR